MGRGVPTQRFLGPSRAFPRAATHATDAANSRNPATSLTSQPPQAAITASNLLAADPRGLTVLVVSAGATAASLSDTQAFPCFVRTCPAAKLYDTCPTFALAQVSTSCQHFQRLPTPADACRRLPTRADAC